MAFSPSGAYLASGSGDMTIGLWNTLDWERIGSISGHSGYVYSVAFSPNGRVLASGAGDRTVSVWNLDQRLVFNRFK